MTDLAPLSPNEIKTLFALSVASTELDLDATARAAGLDVAQTRSALESLKLKGLAAQTRETSAALVSLGDAGKHFAEHGAPEHAIWKKLESGEVTIAEAQAIAPHDAKTAGAAFGWLKQNGFVAVVAGKVKRDLEKKKPFAPERLAAFDAVFKTLREAPVPRERLEPAFLERYGKALAEKVTVERYHAITDAGRATAAKTGTASLDAPAALTKDMLKTGKWREVLETTGFRPYAIAAPPTPSVGRRDPYREFLDSVKRTLLGLGFEEMTGSLVETEFWDMDALFLPQFHPAREIHDVYFVDDGKGGYAKQQSVGADEAGAIEAVALEHEGRGVARSRGWGYQFDRERTKRCVLRSQGTVLSARWLSRKDLKNPGKYFAMARCFRYDTVDATHAPDFFQIEGIVHSDKTSFRHLLGLLKLFALEVARAPEVQFVPAYFPFTEPSVEVQMKHPHLGWIELGGAGIFRPEVTLPHGVTTPVIAWGLGLDRMAMVALGIKDIRELFTNNVPNGLQAVPERLPR